MKASGRALTLKRVENEGAYKKRTLELGRASAGKRDSDLRRYKPDEHRGTVMTVVEGVVGKDVIEKEAQDHVAEGKGLGEGGVPCKKDVLVGIVGLLLFFASDSGLLREESLV